MVSSEVESLARTGGLGDVVEALSRALGASGIDVVVATPKYGVTRVPVGARWWPSPVVAPLGLGHRRELGVLEARLGPSVGAPRACMLADAQLFDRPGIYGDAHATFDDNAFRFAAMSSGALSVAEHAWGGEMPDVVHAHDWHAALSLVYARKTRGPRWARVPLVFTIHNLAYQGVLGERELEYIAVPRAGWDEGWIRHEGNVNLMRGAVEIADRVTAVSETYAGEIQRAPKASVSTRSCAITGRSSSESSTASTRSRSTRRPTVRSLGATRPPARSPENMRAKMLSAPSSGFTPIPGHRSSAPSPGCNG
jgi:starch synthase